MENILDFFATIPSSYRTALLVGGLVLFWAIEGVLPMYKFKYNKIKHAGINMFFTLTTVVINFGLAFLLVKTSDYVAQNQFGLMYLIDLPLWVQVVIGLMVLDLIGAYTIHFIEHKVKWMWGFHLIHHSDTNVDVTSGLRHHPGESVFRFIFTTMAVIIAGAPMGVIMLYQSLSVIFTHLTHANVSVFGKLDKPLSMIFVTPNMHKVHHHYLLPWTDTNFGNIFSIWDRIFGTFVYVDDMAQVKYGIDTHMEAKEHENLGRLLAIPFEKYRKPTTEE